MEISGIYAINQLTKCDFGDEDRTYEFIWKQNYVPQFALSVPISNDFLLASGVHSWTRANIDSSQQRACNSGPGARRGSHGEAEQRFRRILAAVMGQRDEISSRKCVRLGSEVGVRPESEIGDGQTRLVRL